jgi:hypothetical protein
MAVIRFLTAGTVTPSSDGTVAVTLQCTVPVPCRGALLLDAGTTSVCKPPPHRVSWSASSDLEVAGNSTRTLGLQLRSCAQQLLQQRGHLKADLTVSVNSVPSCDRIPQLAAGCKRFTSSPSWTPDQGDGLDRIPSGGITLAARSGAH